MKPNGTPQYEREFISPPDRKSSSPSSTDPEKNEKMERCGGELDPKPGGIYRVVVTEKQYGARRVCRTRTLPANCLHLGLGRRKSALPGTSTVEVS